MPLTDGGGSFSCLVYRRTTRYIRVPTTLVGLIDASVSNRVAVNWKGLKNRLGGYHEPVATIIDRTFLSTIPNAEIRNGIAELIKIFCTTHIQKYTQLETHGQALITTRFGLIEQPTQTVVKAAHEIIQQGTSRSLFPALPRPPTRDLILFFPRNSAPNTMS